VTLSPEARTAWLADARVHLAERRAERHAQSVAHARGQLPLPAADVSGLRRRRQASLRCEPLDAAGRRDPMSTRRRMPALTLHVEVGKRTAWLHGERIVELLDAAQVERRQWDWQRRLWMVPIDRADDVITYAEWRQRRVVTVEAIDR
jgi:hypothetical protein